jgi:hypothetical protein
MCNPLVDSIGRRPSGPTEGVSFDVLVQRRAGRRTGRPAADPRVAVLCLYTACTRSSSSAVNRGSLPRHSRPLSVRSDGASVPGGFWPWRRRRDSQVPRRAEGPARPLALIARPLLQCRLVGRVLRAPPRGPLPSA